MSDKARSFLLILLMTLIAVVIAGYSISSLYQVALEETKRELRLVVSSQARLIEAIAQFDVDHSGRGSIEEGMKATLSQIRQAHKANPNSHQTAEFVLAHKVGEQIVFLLREDLPPARQVDSIAANSHLAEPMRRAIAGQSGIIEGLDYQGRTVLAAFEPIAIHHLGLVAKIDLAEIQAPFYTVLRQVIAISVVIITLSGFLFLRLINPLIRQLQDKTQKLALMGEVFSFASEAIVVTDANNHIIEVNQAYCDITGYSKAEVLGQNPSITSSGRQGEQFYQNMWKQLNRTGHWEGEIWDRKKNGELFPKNLKITRFQSNTDLEVDTKYLAIFSDISREKATEEQLKQLAFFDPLTGLANRAHCLSELSSRLLKAQRDKSKLAVMFLDLDGFKAVNDSFGHKAGDSVLCEVAELLTGRVRASDLVARLGGDEFLIILSEQNAPEDSIAISQEILEKFKNPIMAIEEQPIYLNCSIGISFYPNDATNSQDLIRYADFAMYSAKQHGKGQFYFYSAEIEQKVIHRLSLEYKLHQAIDKKQFVVFYQPQVHSRTGQVVGIESLVRWISPEDGMVSPGTFIPMAEETGMIKQIGQFVLEESCRQMVEWQAQGLSPLVVSVNCSLKQFEDNNLAQQVRAALETSGLSPQWLKIEITESLMMDQRYDILGQLHELRKIGVGLSMDDFGTGYSSLSVLKTLPLTDLKIDRAFVSGIVEDQLIARVVADLAQDMDLKVVAEGAEEWPQIEVLDQLGCNVIQGFYYSKPLVADKCLEYIKSVKRKTIVG